MRHAHCLSARLDTASRRDHQPAVMITAPEFYVVAIPAVILAGLAKGGFAGLGQLSLPLMALVISPVQGAAILLPILVVQDVIGVMAYRKSWDAANLKALLPPACAGIFAGYALAAFVSVAAVELALGLLAITFGARELWRRRSGPSAPSGRGGVLSAWVWGSASGFSSMIAHAGLPPFHVYVLPQNLPPMILAGTGAIFFGTVNVIKILPYAALGQLNAENLTTAALLFPLAILSTMAGVVLVRGVQTQKFYTAIFTLLIGVGCKLLWDGVADLRL